MLTEFTYHGKKKKITRPDKEENLLNKIRKAILLGNYYETEHAKQRAKKEVL